MADRSVLLAVKVVTDSTQAALGLDKAAGKTGKFAGAMQKAMLPAAAVGGAILAFGKAAVDSASRTEQAMGAVESVFGKNAGTVKKWAGQAASAVGLAKSEYAELASVIGSQLKNLGLPQDQVLGKTKDLIKMGADLAATYGGTTADAVKALSAALRGETDPIEQYGISIKQADIAAQRAKDGTDKLTGSAGKAAQAQATLALMTKQSTAAHGAFARESDTAAHAQQVAAAQYENAKSALGTALLPAMAALMKSLAGVAKWAQQNSRLVQVLIGVLGGLVVAVFAINAALKVYRATLIVVSAVQKAAWLSNPIFLVIGAVILLVAAIVLLWKRSETFRRIVKAVWAAVQAGAKATARAITAGFRAAWAFVSGGARKVAAVVRAVFAGVRNAGKVTWAVITRAARMFGANVRSVFNVIRNVARAVGQALKAAWRAVWAAAMTYVRTYAAVVRAVMNAVRGTVRAVVSFIKDRFRDAWNDVKSAVRTVSGPIESAMNSAERAVQGAVNAVQSFVSWLGRINPPGSISGAFNSIRNAINGAIGAVRSLISWLGRIHVPHISLPGRGKSAPAATVARGVAAPTVLGASHRVAAPTSSAGGVSITVNGALDPDAVARQILKILDRHKARIGAAA